MPLFSQISKQVLAVCGVTVLVSIISFGFFESSASVFVIATEISGFGRDRMILSACSAISW